MLIEYNENHPLGKNLLRLRKRYCMSRRTLARLCEVSEYGLERIEEGPTTNAISCTFLQRLTQIFNVDPEALFSQNME